MAMAKVQERLVEGKLTFFEVKEHSLFLHPSVAPRVTSTVPSCQPVNV